MSDTKLLRICPYCEKEIGYEAIVCRYCDRYLLRTTETQTRMMSRLPVAFLAIVILCLVGVAVMTILLLPSISKIDLAANTYTAWMTEIINFPRQLEYSACIDRSIDLVKEEDYTSAIDELGRAIEIEPQKPEAYLSRGILYLMTNDDEDLAIADFDRVIEIDPENAGAFFFRGDTYAYKGDLNQALSDFDRAVEIDPKMVEAYIGRGKVYMGTGPLYQAIFEFNKAIELDPGETDAFIQRGRTYGRQLKYLKAIADFDTALEIDPQDADAYYYRGVILAEIGRNEESIKDFERAIMFGLQNDLQKHAEEMLADLKE